MSNPKWTPEERRKRLETQAVTYLEALRRVRLAHQEAANNPTPLTEFLTPFLFRLFVGIGILLILAMGCIIFRAMTGV